MTSAHDLEELRRQNAALQREVDHLRAEIARLAAIRIYPLPAIVTT